MRECDCGYVLALDVNVHRRGGQVRVKALGVRFEPSPSHEGSPPDEAAGAEQKPSRVLH
jgi:hypothetical protein